MGHSRSDIFDKYYTSDQIKIDVQSAYLGCPTKDALVAVSANMGVTRDPRAPKRLTKEQKQAAFDNDPELQELSNQISFNELQIKTIPVNQRKVVEDFSKLKIIQRKLISRKKKTIMRCIRNAEKDLRAAFFSDVHTKDIERQRRGIDAVLPSRPRFVLTERNLFANLVDHARGHRNSNQRNEALDILGRLCSLQENSSRTNLPDDSISEKAMNEIIVEPSIEGSVDLDLFPMQCPSYQCLFCLGNINLPTKARTHGYSQSSSLKRHVNNLHLEHHDPKQEFACPHPTCNQLLSGTEHFKNHAFMVHNVRL